MKKKSRERFQEIVKVFASYGFGYLLDSTKKDKKSPENLRKAIEELGPTFIKIGQILSTQSDIFPKEYVQQLTKLQDSVPTEDEGVLREEFEKSLNKKMDECFLYFNEKPLASASIAQVHEAILKDGRKVVVKIQRPDIYEKMKMDISILRRIIKFTNTRINIKIVDPLEVLDEIDQTTESELDFIVEGRNILRFKENNKNVNAIHVPDLITNVWSKKVLVLEEIDGFKINDLEKLKKDGYDNKDVAEKLALSYCKQIFEDGFFHADPHPGNLLISNNKICFIDFGIMGELSDSLREWLNSAIAAIATKDKEKIVDCILAIGIKDGIINRGDLYEDISSFFDTYLTTSLKNIKISMLLQEMFEITRENNIQLPKELVILVRGLMILEGVIAEIDPEIEIASVVGSYVKSKDIFSIIKGLDKEQMLLEIYGFTRDLVRIPTRTIEVLNKVASGKVETKVTVNSLENIIGSLDTMINRATVGIVTSAIILSSSLLVSNKIEPCYKGLSVIGLIGYGISFIFAMILLINAIKHRYFSKKR